MAAENATSARSKRTTSKRATLTKLWGIRLGIVLAAGFVAGATAGVVGVNTLEPGRPSEPDSLAVLLDSISRGVAAPVPGARGTGAPPQVAAPGATQAPPDTASASSTLDETLVPDLVGTEEGAARTSLTSAGLNVGTIEFRASASPAGTVLATIPVFNAKVKRGTPVALVLSDGRGNADTLTRVPNDRETTR